MENVCASLVMTLLKVLLFLVLIVLHHLILIIEKKKLLVLVEGPTDDFNDSTGAAEK